jgi:hypothetical protein
MNRQHKKGIINQISKRFQTTMIGSLARFEDAFGKPLTDKQLEFLESWDYVRTSILNHGNNQMREAIDEIIDHIEKEQELYRYHFLINKNNQRSEDL